MQNPQHPMVSPDFALPDGTLASQKRGRPLIVAFAPDEWNPARAASSELYATLAAQFGAGISDFDTGIFGQTRNFRFILLRVTARLRQTVRAQVLQPRAFALQPLVVEPAPQRVVEAVPKRGGLEVGAPLSRVLFQEAAHRAVAGRGSYGESYGVAVSALRFDGLSTGSQPSSK